MYEDEFQHTLREIYFRSSGQFLWYHITTTYIFFLPGKVLQPTVNILICYDRDANNVR